LDRISFSLGFSSIVFFLSTQTCELFVGALRLGAWKEGRKEGWGAWISDASSSSSSSSSSFFSNR
jgi:hypothetical protein